jgi:hypothetical protein
MSDTSLSNSLNQSSQQTAEKILPRTAWNNELAYLKAVMKAKRSLDRIEQDHSALRNSR